jgi:hypothetical protein
MVNASLQDTASVAMSTDNNTMSTHGIINELSIFG